jgi:hypothetical protein
LSVALGLFNKWGFAGGEAGLSGDRSRIHSGTHLHSTTFSHHFQVGAY